MKNWIPGIVVIYLVAVIAVGIWAMHGYPTGHEPWDVQMQMWQAVRQRHDLELYFFMAGFLPLKLYAILRR